MNITTIMTTAIASTANAVNTVNKIEIADTNKVNMDAVAAPVVQLIDSLLNPVLAIVGALGAIYCVLLGVKYARADEPQEHEKAKKALKNAIIGFVLIFVLMLSLKIGMPILQTWVANFK